MINEDDKNLDEFQDDNFYDDDDYVNSEIPAVADKGKKGSPLVVVGILAVAIIIIVMIMSGDDEATKVEEDEESGTKKKAAPVNIEKGNIPNISDISSTPGSQAGHTQAPPPPPPPPPPPRDENTGILGDSQLGGSGRSGGPGGRNNVMDERIKSNIMLTGAGKGGAVGSTSASGIANVGETNALQTEATIAGNPKLMIFQGKVIDAVLETAINTDLPGGLRAVVSRDVYAHQGRKVLIPKGSRLLGVYNNVVSRGQYRVYITWTRVILPNGVDVNIESPAIDQLGRSGVEGHLNNKLFDLYTNAILQSAITISIAAIAGDGEVETTTSTTTGDDTGNSGSVVDLATLEAVRDFSDTIKTTIDQFSNVAPTITIDQGVKVKVFVARDIIFDKSLVSNTRVIQ